MRQRRNRPSYLFTQICAGHAAWRTLCSAPLAPQNLSTASNCAHFTFSIFFFFSLFSLNATQKEYIPAGRARSFSRKCFSPNLSRSNNCEAGASSSLPRRLSLTSLSAASAAAGSAPLRSAPPRVSAVSLRASASPVRHADRSIRGRSQL